MATKAKIVQGQDRTVTVQLVRKRDGEPYSLEGFTSATGYFPSAANDDGIAVSGSVVSSDLGRVKFVMDEATTALLKAGEDQNFEVIVDQGETRTIVQFEERLDVFARYF